MLNSKDTKYKGFTYRVGGTQQGSGPRYGEVRYARNEVDGSPGKEERTIQVHGKFSDLNAAMDAADRHIRAMIDRGDPALDLPE